MVTNLTTFAKEKTRQNRMNHKGDNGTLVDAEKILRLPESE